MRTYRPYLHLDLKCWTLFIADGDYTDKFGHCGHFYGLNKRPFGRYKKCVCVYVSPCISVCLSVVLSRSITSVNDVQDKQGNPEYFHIIIAMCIFI